MNLCEFLRDKRSEIIAPLKSGPLGLVKIKRFCRLNAFEIAVT